MKLIVHYGLAKTGTTSLQQALHTGQRALLREGVLYPDGYLPTNAHHILTGLFKPPQDLWPHMREHFRGEDTSLRAKGREVLQDIKRQIDRHRPETVVLSSEMFFGWLTREGQETFRDLLREISNDIDTCLYIRSPAPHYLSLLQQNAKKFDTILQPQPLQVRREIEVIETVFGRPMIVRPFEKDQLHDQDVVHDFVAYCIKRPDLAGRISSTRANESISPELVAISAMSRRINHPGHNSILKEHQFLLRRLSALSSEEGAPSRPQLKPGLAEAINRASTDLLWLRERYGLRFGDVDYTTIDGKTIAAPPQSLRIEDICVVDEALRDRILYRTLHAGIHAQMLQERSLILRAKRLLGKIAASRKAMR